MAQVIISEEDYELLKKIKKESISIGCSSYRDYIGVNYENSFLYYCPTDMKSVVEILEKKGIFQLADIYNKRIKELSKSINNHNKWVTWERDSKNHRILELEHDNSTLDNVNKKLEEELIRMNTKKDTLWERIKKVFIK